MPGSYTEVTSPSQLSSILSANRSTIVDFHATWCGPCHAIAPVFEQLAKQHAATGKVAFCKVDTDANREIVSQYGISAMPTFLVFRGSSVTETIRGANTTALRNAVSKAVEAAGGADGTGASFGSKGYRLGGDSASDSKKPATTTNPSKANAMGTGSGGRKLGAQGTAAGAGASMLPDLGQTADAITRFMGLYLVTLFSLDPYTAAQNSPLNVNQRR